MVTRSAASSKCRATGRKSYRKRFDGFAGAPVEITLIFRARTRIVSPHQRLDDSQRLEKREENERKWKYGRFTRVATRPASHAES
jgi:hypothetical protein